MADIQWYPIRYHYHVVASYSCGKQKEAITSGLSPPSSLISLYGPQSSRTLTAVGCCCCSDTTAPSSIQVQRPLFANTSIMCAPVCENTSWSEWGKKHPVTFSQCLSLTLAVCLGPRRSGKVLPRHPAPWLPGSTSCSTPQWEGPGILGKDGVRERRRRWKWRMRQQRWRGANREGK